jgi:hypothetical protein
VPNNGNNGETYDAVIASGTLTQDIVTGVTIQRLFMSGGVLVLTNPLTLNAGLQFSGGTIRDGALFVAGVSTQSATMTVNNTQILNTGEYNLTLPSGSAFSGGGSAFSNSDGTLRKTGAGSVDFNIELNNSDGMVLVENGTLRLTAGGVSAGLFSVSTGAVLELASNYRFPQGAAFAGAGLIRIQNGRTIEFGATIDNNGNIRINSTGSFTDALLTSSVTLTGNGVITLANAARIRGTGILTNVSNTINGESANFGSLGANEIGIVNQAAGVIDANVSGLFLNVDPNAANGLLNQGLMQASNGGLLRLTGQWRRRLRQHGRHDCRVGRLGGAANRRRIPHGRNTEDSRHRNDPQHGRRDARFADEPRELHREQRNLDDVQRDDRQQWLADSRVDRQLHRSLHQLRRHPHGRKRAQPDERGARPRHRRPVSR